jgi:hypothetical protein
MTTLNVSTLIVDCACTREREHVVPTRLYVTPQVDCAISLTATFLSVVCGVVI